MIEENKGIFFVTFPIEAKLAKSLLQKRIGLCAQHAETNKPTTT